MRWPGEKQLPKKLWIKNKWWIIKVVNVIEKDRTILGICYRKKPLIRLKRTKSNRKLFARFTHELLHAFEFSYNIKIKHKSVYKMEKAITNFMRDNW